MKKLFITLLMLSSLTLQAYNKDASVETSGFSPALIRPNATTRYTVTIKNISAELKPSDIPFPSGLQIVGQRSGQNFVINNSVATRSTVYTYSIIANKEGEYTIPEWKIKLAGQEFTIPQSVLKVSMSAPEEDEEDQDQFARDIFSTSMPNMMRQHQMLQRQQQHSYETSFKDKIKLELKIPKEKIYVGESVPCQLVFSVDKNILQSGLQLQQFIPQAKQADAFECTPLENPIEDNTSDSKNIKLVYDMILTPIKVGTHALEYSAEGVFLRSININDMMNMSLADAFPSFGMRQPVKFNIATKELKIDVIPLPQDSKPKNFSGAIGKFSFGKITLDSDALTVGDPCTINVPLIGSGNFARVGAPVVSNTPDWKSYKPKSSFQDESMGYDGVKTFNFSIVPQKADLKYTPSIEFSYFNPSSAKYETLQSKPFEVSVAPSGRYRKIEKEAQEKNEPTFEKIADAKDVIADNSIFSSSVFWGTQILALAGIAFFVVSRKKRLRLESDPAFAKYIQSMQNADSYLKLAISAANNNNGADFFKNAKPCIQYCIAANSDLDARAILFGETEKLLYQRNANENIIRAAKEIFNGEEAISFGNLELSYSDLKYLSDELKQIYAFAKKIHN